MIPGQSAGAVGVLRRCVVRGLARARRSSPVVSRPSSPHGAIPVLPVLQYPHPQLRADNEEITRFDERLLGKARAMFKNMYLLKGVGLAAPQLGINERLIVLNDMGGKGKGNPKHELVLVNPEIIKSSDTTDMDGESCLSIPLVYGNVERSFSVVVRYHNLDGEKKEEQFYAYQARIISMK